MTEFGNRPPEFAVHKIGNTAQINFYTDIEQLPDTENGERWQANELPLTVPWRQGLEQTIAANPPAWLVKAQEASGIEPSPTIEQRVDTLETDMNLIAGGAPMKPELMEKLLAKKAAQNKAKADHAKADKSVNVKSLDARLKIIEAMLGLNEPEKQP